MGQWIRFFVGTPQRFVGTSLVVGLIVVLTNPGLLRTAGERLVAEVSPLVGPAIMLGIVILGFRLMLGIGRGGHRRR